jgi:hypothetical protein
MKSDLIRTGISAFSHAELGEITASKHVLDYILRLKSTFPCSCYHSAESCNPRLLKRGLLVMLALLKVNIPIHVLPAIMFKFKNFKEK